MQTNLLLKQTCLLVMLTGVLWAWHLFARVLPTPALFGVWLGVCGLLGLGLWQQAKTRRRVWLGAYLLKESRLYRLLRGGLWMALVQLVLAVSMAYYLLLALVRLEDPVLWGALLAGALALPVCAKTIEQSLNTHTVPQLRSELSLRLGAMLISSVLFGLYVWHAFNSPMPDFRDASVEQAVWFGIPDETARSDFLLTQLEIAVALEGLQQWLVQHLMPTPGTSLWQGLGWGFVLAREAVFVWSYLLVCRGVLVCCTPPPDDTSALNEERHASL